MRAAIDNSRRRALAITGAVALAVLALAFTPGLLGPRLHQALDGIGQAQPGWLWLGALGFVASLVGSAGAWRSAVMLAGGRLGLLDANARYGAGSLVNTFVPARAGDAVRLALFARTVEGEGRVWSTGGAIAAVGAARAVGLAVLVVCGAAVGALPLWPLLVLGAMVALATAIAWRFRGSQAHGRISHALDAFRALGREPLAGVRIVAWVLLATLGRVGAAAAVAASLGVRSPLAAAIIVVPALDLTSLVPLTPGNIGITSGAVAMALQAHGVGLTQALSTGIVFHGVETGVSLLYGVLGLLVGAGTRVEGPRRLALVAVASSACIALAAAAGFTFLGDVV